MRVAVTGSRGLVGSALVQALTIAGDEVIPIVRVAGAKNAAFWDPVAGTLDTTKLEGIDAVVHLAGENVASRRWTAVQKRRIRDSRVKGTAFLCERLAAMAAPPKTLVAASAIGYYGDRGAETLSDDSPPGDGFLANVCKEWEATTQPAESVGIRVVKLRIGVVLTSNGGALKKMLGAFKWGAGGIVGDGRQYFSWISIDDVVGAIQHALVTESLSGAVNVVSPNPVTNRAFTKTLGRILSRPTLLPMPRFAAKLAFGEMAEELLLSSARVIPDRLQDSGYVFQHSELEASLRQLV